MNRIALYAIGCALLSCQGHPRAKANQSAVPARPVISAALAVARLKSAERRRDSSAIEREALSSRDASVRRAAARALARIADGRAAELLALALSDEDSEVITWGAYGLGYTCRGRERKAVPALVARAAGLTSANLRTESALASPIEAITDALGRCASPDAESTLRAWLRGPKARAESAALSLGRVVERQGRLEDATLVALLDVAIHEPDPLQNALYPFSRLSALNASTAERALALARSVLQKRGPGAELAIRSLARSGDAGGAELARLLADSSLPPALRSEAARELAALGDGGQRALWAAFDATIVQKPSDAELSGDAYGPLSALLDALAPPFPSSALELRTLAELPLDPLDSTPLKRRKVHVRCTAAALLAASNDLDARLSACDPATQSLPRDLAALAVLGRAKLVGRRKTAYLADARSQFSPIRKAALEILSEHAELDDAYRVLSEGLSAPALGVVASAAHVLASYPERADRNARPGAPSHLAPSPDSSVVQALPAAFTAARNQNNIEVQSLLLDATGALQVLSAKDWVTSACKSDNPTLREHAEKALHLLGERTRLCDASRPGDDRDSASGSVEKTALSFETEVGTLSLTLDPTFAPSAVGRVIHLAQTGFYDGMAVHRVVPGFVVQFGDPEGDGYGGDGQPPLRCETSPVPFLTGDVGVALSGRDTGSSQLFVTLGRYPHLDGQYAWIGRAGPGWDRVTVGDRILHVLVRSVP